MKKSVNEPDGIVTDDSLTVKLTAKPSDGIVFQSASGEAIADGILSIQGETAFKVYVLSFSGTKPAKVTVTATCVQNGKKASSKITVSNGVKAMAFSTDSTSATAETGTVDLASADATASADGLIRVTLPNPASKKTTAKFSERITSWAGNETTTDKNSIYRIGTADGFSFNDGKVEVTAAPTKQQKKVALVADKKSGSAAYTVTANKGTAEGTIAYFLIFHNEEAYEVVAAGIGDGSLDDLVIDKADSREITLWANAANDMGSCSVSASAGYYKDKKNKSVKGKIVWASATSVQSASSFGYDSTKHKFSSARVDKTVATVSKGLITAKKAGTAYVYALDTSDGSIVKTVKVTVVDSPTAVRLFEDEETPANTNDVAEYKTATVPEGETVTIYARGVTGKKGNYTASEPEGITYKAVIPSNYEKANLVASSSGNAIRINVPEGSFKALNAKKAVKIPISITASNGKKAVFNLMVGNPVIGYTFTSPSGMSVTANTAEDAKYDFSFSMSNSATKKKGTNATATIVLNGSAKDVSTVTDTTKVIALGTEPDNYKANAKGAYVVKDKTKITSAVKNIKLSVSKGTAKVTIPKNVGSVSTYFMIWSNSYDNGEGKKGYAVVKVTAASVSDGTNNVVGTGASDGAITVDSVKLINLVRRWRNILPSQGEKDFVFTYGGFELTSTVEEYDFGIIGSDGNIQYQDNTDKTKLYNWSDVILGEKNGSCLALFKSASSNDGITGDAITVTGTPELKDTITVKNSIPVIEIVEMKNYKGDSLTPSDYLESTELTFDEEALNTNSAGEKLLKALLEEGPQTVLTYGNGSAQDSWIWEGETFGWDRLGVLNLQWNSDHKTRSTMESVLWEYIEGGWKHGSITIRVRPSTPAPTATYTRSNSKVTAADDVKAWKTNTTVKENKSNKCFGSYIAGNVTGTMKVELGITPVISNKVLDDSNFQIFFNKYLAGKTIKCDRSDGYNWKSTDGTVTLGKSVIDMNDVLRSSAFSNGVFWTKAAMEETNRGAHTFDDTDDSIYDTYELTFTAATRY